MSVPSVRALTQPGTKTRATIVTTAVALAAVTLAAPSAGAADKWGPGFLIPDSAGHAGASHLGAYGAPGAPLPGINGLAYCADPELSGPDTAGRYGPATDFTTWTSRATGKKASPQDVARAAYLLSQYGETTRDAQAAAIDADIYTFLEPGSTYALPDGKRALQRLAYPAVPATTKNLAQDFLAEAATFAGPYTLNVHPTAGPFTPGKTTPVTLDVTSASGHKMPGIKLELDVSGAAAGAGTVTTNADGIATAIITPTAAGTVDIKALAKSLPATALRAVAPSNTKAQRMLLTGGRSTAQAQAQLTVATPHGGLTLTKTAADTGAPLPGVVFAVKDSAGKTVATGATDAHGVWTAADLTPGAYTVHEVAAVEGYQLAADQDATVTEGTTARVAVKDTKIPALPKPKPRPVTITVLPKTGA
ncbi:SpaA isopeptide-forming pilin-related protein [Streptomyces sp. H10-C2]|uniref:SpaA isopeptide-forming pilin-related protein n=1 Tax=unclassified Streptomyces TaxID=2593676 RepID=UPI0024B91599|nr:MULTISPECIES: SpaA isopeptide-forming pilin-related protein [unclassified Streptomyces]MDJ0342822.1 SpaA isopeptide-forming pilin-related protein [Streptomyces sp. PH10-H1]MDJ0372500.1 SpaA isopeptide-forming pilin-related protein [Streptomyces sp. H10-C2]